MTNLPTWQKPIAWTLIVIAFPFVCLWRAYVSAKWTVWAGRIYLNKEAHHGQR